MSQNSSISKSFKEIPAADNPIPLSPQWLLPKPGENKTGMSAGENRPNPFTCYGDVTTSPLENGEESDKKKDALMAVAESGGGRRDRWRDEERDTVTLTNPLARRERWREGDKDIITGKADSRWGVDYSSSRRWAADPTREINNNNSNYDQRRENKWNARWGPDDKEMDDKWTAGGRHVDMSHEKISHGQDEKEGDHYRPWRPSSLLGRAKPELPHHQNRTTPKEAPMFGHGRERAESASSFSVGRGRVNYGSGSVTYSIHSYTSGLNSDRGGDNSHGEPSPFRYSRTKLLDIYRLTDVTSSTKILDGLMQVPSLTQEEPLEPLALSAPTPEESAIFKGIDKGEVVSSGAAQISKDGSTGRSTSDFPHSRRINHGSKDDVSLPPDDKSDKVDHSKGASLKFSEGLPHENQMHAYGSDVTIDKSENHAIYGDDKISLPAVRDDDNVLKKGVEVTDSGTQGRLYAQSASPWRSPSVELLANTQSRDWRDTPNDIRSRSSDIPWSQAPKGNSIEWGNVLTDPYYAHNELKWKVGEGSAVRKHPAVDREQESKKLLQPSPEDLLLYYKDPQGQIQGPFTGSDIIGWFEAGYFGIDLQVRLVNTATDSPFSLLGDVMPHLRAKARPPPGFSSAKQTEVPDVSSRSTLTGFRNVLPGPSGISLLGNEHRHTYESSTEAENRFIESLMSGDVSSSLERFAASEGPQGFVAQTSNSTPPLGTESGEAVNLLAQRMNLERQKSFSHPYSYWSTREGAPVGPGPDITRNSNVPQANLLPIVGDMPCQSLSQTAEMMAILQGLSDRSSSGMNNGLGGWPNFSVQGGIDPFKDNKIELHHVQNFPQVAYGMQQHKLLPQNSPPLTNLLSQQILENPSMLPDKILSTGLTQDPQVLNLLQQQFLLQQLQSQQSAAGQQLSLLDKILLIKQQQKQEEQQQLLQQQKLLSQVLSEQQLAQRFGDPTLGQLQASAPLVGNSAIEQSVSPPSPSMFQMNSQISVSGMPDDRIASIANMPPQVPQDFCHTTESSSFQLPHQMLANLQQNCPSMSDHNLSSLSEMMENLATSEALGKHPSAAPVENSTCEFSAPSSVDRVIPTSVVSEQSVLSSDSVLLELSESFDCKSSVDPQDNEILNFERDNDAKSIPVGALEETSVKECCEEAPAANGANNAEAREVKKTSDKKSRKMKSSKAQPSPKQVKGASKGSTQKAKQSEAEGALIADKLEVSVTTEATLDWRPMEAASEIPCPPENDLSISSTLQSDAITQQSVPVNSAQRAWKPAASVKPKSLLEIQQEEQKAQLEIPASSISASVSPLSSSTPWAGVITHVEPKISREIHQDSASEHKTEISKSMKSGLHDLLAAEVLAKSSDRSIEVDNSSSLPPLPTVSNQRDVVDDENFIEAKDTKKSRKKAAKAKVAGAKVSAAVSSTDAMIASSPVEKGKSSKHVQAVKEVLPAPPSGPSFGDFVCWKGESTSPSPVLAWSTDSGKFPKPTSLRDILKEQEKKVTPAQQHSPIATPQKSQFAQAHPGSRSVSASSPSKAASPVQIHSQLSSQSKSKGDDDFFWGPLDQSRVVFPQLGNQRNWATKSTPSKETPGASINRQKSTVGRAVENYVLSPPASGQVAVKGKRDGSTKHLEAMDFRDWCESESVRLTGSKDTSFLEFCSKQSRSEAQALLVENLSSFDPNHEFIDKFLNYLELLSADVLELAFKSRNDLKAAYKNGGRDMNSDNLGFVEFEKDSVASSDGSIKGGKKKGKKGKKVSPSVLGFNVVSNRIMMGEIQSVED